MVRINFTYGTFSGKTTFLYFLKDNETVHLFDGRDIPGVIDVESKVSACCGRGRSRHYYSDYWIRLHEGVKPVSFMDPLPASIKSLSKLATSLHVTEPEAEVILQVHNQDLLERLL